VLELQARFVDGRRYSDQVLVPDLARRTARFDIVATLLTKSREALAAHNAGLTVVKP
jgi:hypothetical protein